jgi:hypothetical protein
MPCALDKVTPMSYYDELSDYTYHYSAFYRPGTKNVGWLDPNHEFKTAEPTDAVLDKLWSFCKISIAQTRGVHECEFCADSGAYRAERNGEILLLGTSEIRVFSEEGTIYGAPTLIYHYMAHHKYAPPDAFLRALKEGPAPPDQVYFDRLKELGLAWNKTSTPTGMPIKIF